MNATAPTSASTRRGPTAKTDFAAAFADWSRARAGLEPAAWSAARAAAFERFRAGGLPSSRCEAWRYLNLGALAKAEFQLARSSALDAADLAAARVALAERRLGGAAATLVFVDGRFVRELSDDVRAAGLDVHPLADVLAEESMPESSDAHPFVDLNTAFFADGARVRVARDAAPTGPVHLLFLQGGRGRAVFPRVHVELAAHARLSLVEEHAALSEGADLVAPVTRVHLARGAELRHARVHGAASSAFELATADVVLQRDAAWRAVSVLSGGAIARDELRVRHAGAGGRAELHTLALADGTRQADVEVDLLHAAPHCTSRQVLRAVVDGRARGISESRVAVAAGADGTDSAQSLRSLLLSDGAIADVKPQLEVLADDVQCSHGATVGQLDADALFFLRARGIDAARARALLTLAFAGEVIAALPVDALRERMTARLENHLTGSAAAVR